MPEISLSPAWIWAIIGVILIIIELTSFTFILTFLGAGAIITAITTWVGLTGGVNSQLAFFSISSVLMMLLLRKTAKKLFYGSSDLSPDYLGQRVKVVREIPVGGEGYIQYRGSEWIAFSDHPDIIPEGSNVEIVGIEGIRVKVTPVT